MKKLNIKKIVIFVLIVVVLVVLVIFGIKKGISIKKMKSSYEYKLQNIGYTENESNIFKSKLSDKELDKLLKKKIDKRYVELVKEENFSYDKLDRYINVLNEKNCDIKTSISIVNANVDKPWYEDIENTDTSKKELMLVNKFYKLDEEYKPKLILVSSTYGYEGNYVDESIYDNLVFMLDTARENNFVFVVSQGYRSYKQQEDIYNTYKENNGIREADEYIARPGHSEYQTGLSVDIVPFEKSIDTFEESEEYKWLIENAYRFGFIQRYEKDKENITGFKFDPWRFRYVGKVASQEIYNKKITFDEYYMNKINKE